MAITAWGLFDLYTTDQGTTYKAELLDKPETFSATFTYSAGSATELNRGQASKTWAGDKVFFGWMDTDTLDFPGETTNVHPNILVRAFDVTTGMWTARVNLTRGSDVDGICTFLNMSPYVLGATGTYTIPCTYTKIVTDIGVSVEHHYVDGLTRSDADFSVASNASNALTTFVGVKELDENVASITNLYPNPTTNTASLVLNLKKNAEVAYDIKNILGQTVVSHPGTF